VDFAGYTIYRVTESDTAQVQLGVTATSFLDEAAVNGSIYSYYLTASDAEKTSFQTLIDDVGKIAASPH